MRLASKVNNTENKPPRRVIPLTVERPSALSAAQQAAVREVCARLAVLPGALLPILHGVQQALGYVPPDAVPVEFLVLAYPIGPPPSGDAESGGAGGDEPGDGQPS